MSAVKPVGVSMSKFNCNRVMLICDPPYTSLVLMNSCDHVITD